MRLSILFLFLFASFFEQPPSFKLTFDHKARPVKNLQKSGDFYKNILGFQEITVTANPVPPKRWFINHEGKQLHLITSEITMETNIINHMAFSTIELDEIIAHLGRNAIDFWTDEGIKNSIRIRKDGVRQIKFQDPDGHWIEINESRN